MNKLLHKCGFNSVEEVRAATKKYKTELSAQQLLEGLKNLSKHKVLSGRSRPERDINNLHSFSTGPEPVIAAKLPGQGHHYGRHYVVPLNGAYSMGE